MGRPKKARKKYYKSYFNRDSSSDESDIPESTLRYQKKSALLHADDGNNSDTSHETVVSEEPDAVLQTSNSNFVSSQLSPEETNTHRMNESEQNNRRNSFNEDPSDIEALGVQSTESMAANTSADEYNRSSTDASDKGADSETASSSDATEADVLMDNNSQPSPSPHLTIDNEYNGTIIDNLNGLNRSESANTIEAAETDSMDLDLNSYESMAADTSADEYNRSSTDASDEGADSETASSSDATEADVLMDNNSQPSPSPHLTIDNEYNGTIIDNLNGLNRSESANTIEAAETDSMDLDLNSYESMAADSSANEYNRSSTDASDEGADSETASSSDATEADVLMDDEGLPSPNSSNDDHNSDSEGSDDCNLRDPFEKLKKSLQGSFLNKLHLNVDISVGEILTNALLLVKKHNWNHLEKEDLMKFICSILDSGPIVPNSRYLLDSLFYTREDMNYFFFCTKCSKSIGSVPAKKHRPAQTQCSNCKTVNVLSDLSKCSYFVTFYLPSQIELLLTDPSNRKKLVNPIDFVDTPEDNIMTKLYHGSVYRKFANYVKQSIPSEIKVISFTLSVDSASICDFSGQKICPCFLVINELPTVLRSGNPLLAGLWFGLNKEKLDLFLPPIVKHITKLSLKGFSLKFSNEEWKMKAFLIGCCADSVARCDIQGIHAHRGDFPCSWCLEEGEEFNGNRIFRYSFPLPPPRTIQNILEDAAAALAQGIFVRGVKYLSPLAAAPMFHPVEGFIVDQMHAKDEGTSKSFMKAWLGEFGKQPYYIGSAENVSKINCKLKQVKPPKECRKSIRDLDNLAHWTGRELENWALFLSIPILNNILPRKYLKHWALYVQANFIYLSNGASFSAIDLAENLIEEFCSKVEELYDPKMMRFNLHILRHFAANARRWGPIFELCAYFFEAGNQKLKKLVNSANFIPNQVCRGFSEESALAILMDRCNTPITRKFNEEIQRVKHTDTVQLASKVELFNKTRSYKATEEEQWHVHNMGKQTEEFAQFGYILKDGCHYGSNLSRETKTDNSFAVLQDHSIICIKKVLLHEPTEEVWIVARKVRCEPSIFCHPSVVRLGHNLCFQFSVRSIDEDIDFYRDSDLKTICVNLEFDDEHYLCPMPNIMNMY